MKVFVATLLVTASSVANAANGLTISTLPGEPEEPNPVCRDANGKFSNCTPTAGVATEFLAPVVKTVSGTVIGTLLYVEPGKDYVTFLTPNGYIMAALMFDGQPSNHHSFNQAWFETTDCTGTAYIKSSFGQVAMETWEGNGFLYYTSKTPPVGEITVASYRNYGTCSPIGPFPQPGLQPALPYNAGVVGYTFPSEALVIEQQ